ncbi:MAG: molybdopterin cofactor-binding domain-containing protein, partial [Terriglobia bacterium]
TGKTEIGMGVETAFGQIVAEELDVPIQSVALIMGDTALTPDQGGVGGSTSISMGAKPLRNAAATARALLVHLASRRLGVPSEQLQVSNGVVSVKGDAAKSVSYAELAGGTDLNDALKVSGEGMTLNVIGMGKPKDPASYTIVGTSVPRVDLPPKIFGQFEYVTDVRVDGMLHGRVIRPSKVGAKLVKVDISSVTGIPGFVKAVTKGDFVGVVAETEWSAIRAAEALKVTWSEPQPVFPEQDRLYQHMRSVAPKAEKVMLNRGDAAAAMSNAVKKVAASYEWPYQSHATMGPGCAVADVKPDGSATVWSGTQKPHSLRKGLAELLRVPEDKVRVIWVEDAGSYGRPGYDDSAADAVLLSQAAGKPVRVQWMRADMTAWGTKGPAVICDLVAGLDARGMVSALQFTSIAFSGGETYYRPDSAGNFLGSQLAGVLNTSGVIEFCEWGEQSIAYEFPNVYAAGRVVPAFYGAGSPLRTSHLRDPEGPSVTFAVESFVDEAAAAAGVDPIELRLRHLTHPRAKAALATAAKHSGWDSRPSPKKDNGAAEIATGRGIALGNRRGTWVATVAEVEVNRRTGAVRIKRFVCVQDCGLIVNPNGLRGVVAANLMQSLSRAMKEEVKFNRSNVTSVDWVTYPIVRSSDVPDQVDIVLLNHTDMPPGGAGEPATRPTAAAIANAIFDATGARVRQVPLTPTRVKAALEVV